MKFSLGLLYGVLCAAFIAPAVANVATTAGSNLTAYNGTGSTNNNQWNNLMNGRGGMGTAPATANFGNCNAVILRCATPKCANGGCADGNVAWQIVSGCVNSNASCKKHGDDLINYITAQVVAQSNAKLQEQQNAVAIAQAQAEAQAQASAAAAAQNNAQMQQMQQQMAAMQAQMAESMASMQQQMAAQSESQNAQIQSALESQRETMAAYSASSSTTGDAGESGATIAGLEGLSVAEQLAAKNGISADILVREQMGGKIETAIEDAMTAMKDLKAKLDAVLEYAGCDPSATNCTGPKRVKKFKDLANEFFEPYENVVENVYDALMLAMTLGIDVNDVIMLLSNSCNIWGKYMCNACDPDSKKDRDAGCVCNDSKNNDGCYFRVITDPVTGKVSKNQPYCRLVDTLTEKDTVWREWIDANTGMTGSTQVACASDVIMDISLFRGMKKKATLDIETLRDLVNQDSTTTCRRAFKAGDDPEKYLLEQCGAEACVVRSEDDAPKRWKTLENAVRTKKIPTGKQLCVASSDKWRDNEGGVTLGSVLNESCAAFSISEDLCRSMYDKLGCVYDPDSKKCVQKGVNKIKQLATKTHTDPIVMTQKTNNSGDCSSYNTLAECGEHIDECKWEFPAMNYNTDGGFSVTFSGNGSCINR